VESPRRASRPQREVSDPARQQLACMILEGELPIESGARRVACIETELMPEQLKEQKIQFLLPHRVVPFPRMWTSQIFPGSQFVPGRSNDRVLGGGAMRLPSHDWCDRQPHQPRSRHAGVSSLPIDGLADSPIMTRVFGWQRKSNLLRPSLSPWRGNRMTALLQSTPARARNPLDLARLIQGGSATHAIAGFEPGCGLAATHEHHLPRPVKQAEAPCPAEV